MKPKLRLNIETKVQNFEKTNFKNFDLYFMWYTTAKKFSHELNPYVANSFSFQ